MNEKRLFSASCVALIATAMTFAIRGDIMGDFEQVFELSKTNVGWIAGAAFWGFGLSIYFGGPLCDALGMKPLLWAAAIGHISGTLLTIFAPNFPLLFAATLIIGVANGLVEAVCNPLIATIYPEQKTQKLTLFHAWFPGGIVIGGVGAFLLSQVGFEAGSGVGWQVKMGLILIPSVIYTLMLVGQTFPPTERLAAGVRFGEMFAEAFRRPLFIILFLVMWLTAATELGSGAWLPNIYNDVMSNVTASTATAGILFLVWGNGLMFLLRQFGSGIAHKITPVTLIMCTAPFAAAGLALVTYAQTPLMWFIASSLLFFGVAFWWPTMLGITSERVPRTGALGLAIIGGTGSFSTALAGPAMGWLNDKFGPEKVLVYWAALPVVIFIVFLLIYLNDKAKGGYQAQIERLHKEELLGEEVTLK